MESDDIPIMVLREGKRLYEQGKYRFRMERALFSRCYSEERRFLSGFIEELMKIEKEFDE